ncbi:MAG: EAL domain-containing protein [Pseudomonadota bacterium]|nr:EAL domain-containing protein [Pseudomonadota bacterium]
MTMAPAVFVVDDDGAVRDSIALLLEAEAIAAETYATAEDFLHSCQPGRPGCVVLDIRMPGMDGWALQQRLGEKAIRLPIIFITGHGDVPMAGRAFKAGAFDFIEKPFNSEQLVSRVREAIEWDQQQRQDEPGAATVAVGMVVESAIDVVPELLQVLNQKRIDDKGWAAVTLHSIGDAVITTDAGGRVDYLNPMAERLTGWTDADAHGQPVEGVFRIIDEQSRKPVENLIARCLQQEQGVRGGQYNLLISRNGAALAVDETIAPIRTGQGAVLGMVIVFKDVTPQRRQTMELRHRAEHDGLTDLVNRSEFERRLGHAIAASNTQGAKHALCYLDLDQFKVVNDSAGHAAGDELLRQIASLMMAQVRERDTLARLGGDEFALLLTNCPLQKALEIAELLVAEIGDYHFIWEGRSFQIGVSIGVVMIAGTIESESELLIQADAACYEAKQRGKNRVHFCMREGGIKVRQQSERVRASSLATALEQGSFMLYNQPVMSLLRPPDKLVHEELLVRLMDNEGEVVLPRAFIPTAERQGLMAAIDRWVIRTALERYHDIFVSPVATEIAINLSLKSIVDVSLPQFVRQQFKEFGVAPGRVCFEISETTVVQNFNQAKRFILAMKDEGCRIAIDDFGRGLSSFAYLKKLPIDYLKIDGAVICNMLINPVDHALVEAINDIGHTMAVRTIAKWAESDALVERLTALGVDYAQGNAIRSPSSLERECG